jgi:hypothetical protein
MIKDLEGEYIERKNHKYRINIYFWLPFRYEAAVVDQREIQKIIFLKNFHLYDSYFDYLSRPASRSSAIRTLSATDALDKNKCRKIFEKYKLDCIISRLKRKKCFFGNNTINLSSVYNNKIIVVLIFWQYPKNCVNRK